LKFILTIVEGIGVGLYSNWLYEIIKGKPIQKLVINRKEVLEITSEAIRLTIEEEMKK